jgi:hypothetical protein
MRVFLSILFLVCSLTASYSKSPRADRITDVKAGLMSLDGTKTVKDDSISTGTKVVATAKIVRTGKNIEMLKSPFAIGVDCLIVGSPKGVSAPLKVIWRYPEPGLKSPDSGTTKLTDEIHDPYKIGERTQFFWSFGDSDWVRVPGIWTVEVWQDDRKLLVQEFNLTKP